MIPEQGFLGDEVDVSAPRGRDSMAQGALAVGGVADNNIKPLWGFSDSLTSRPKANAPWAIESRPGWGFDVGNLFLCKTIILI